jgi:TPR repeat protein
VSVESSEVQHSDSTKNRGVRLQKLKKIATVSSAKGWEGLMPNLIPSHTLRATLLASVAVNLGRLYDLGLGVPQDYAAALSWYQKAANQGDAIAQYNLGISYANGRGVPQDYAAAVQWYRKAADQGLPDGQFNLADMYFSGRGVPQDNVMAYMWFDLAAAQGKARADTNRDLYVAKRMTPAQITEAQKLAAEWKPKPVHYCQERMCVEQEGVAYR